ncbi:hypothetical protein PYW07_005805 [Mythimna separata]|uniref:Uncharacterized protein n=1 Tax=Mythimna separata TaxID=271217 RepID=A0AAD7YK73_MYTSE|nr:hypothetical protein PYW07_005805 [Mythimna separata]
MSELSENVRQVIVKLVPACVVNDISCFVFYDKHPSSDINIDITICTNNGEVKEYYQRDLVSAIKLRGVEKPREIKILRNANCDLFYLVFSKEEITILSRKDKLQIHQTVSSVEKYDISDPSCSGQACLRVFRKADAVPLTFDDNFENFKRPDISTTFTETQNDDSLPIITHLMRKLTEAKYSVKYNEKTYKELLDLHQNVAFSTYKKIHPDLNDSVFKDGAKEMASVLRINTQTPWVKVCNKKIVLVLNVCNMNNEPLEDVHILLHGTTGQSIEYTTKLFEKIETSPFWEETGTQVLKYNKNSAIVTVIEENELRSNVVSKIEFNGVIFYKKNGKECLLPMEDVRLCSLDTMGAEFDVLSSVPMDPNIMLAILATTEKTELLLRHTKRPNDEALSLELFCKFLSMERVPHCENVAIHRKSPYHVLNGVMLLMHSETTNANDSLTVSIYSRTPAQVLALIHYIHDAVPLTLIITTPNIKITAKEDSLSKYNEEIIDNTQTSNNYQKYATSILNRTELVLKYLDYSMVKMGESKSSVVQNKIGTEIDLFGGDEGAFLEFKNRMRDEAAKGVKALDEDQDTPESDVMCID